MGTASTRQTHFSHWSVRLLQRNPHTHTHTHILTFYILHDHAEVPAGFEGAEHGDDEGILREGQDVSFHEGLLDLVPQDQVLLIDLLHGESLAGVQMPHQVHSAGTQTHNHRYISLHDLRFDLCPGRTDRCKNESLPCQHILSQWSDRLYSPVRSITDQLDGLEVGFSWRLHSSDLTLSNKGHQSLKSPNQRGC